jgi:RNA polymerase sigma factor (sigma-70 family)
MRETPGEVAGSQYRGNDVSRGPDLESTLARHGAFVRGVARSLVLDEQTADDVAQDTWLAALEHPPRRASGIRSWLGTVARRFSFRAKRGARRRAEREERAARPESHARVADPAQALMLREVIDAVLALDEPYRSTVLMRFYENLEPAEIAAREGIPAATVRTRLKRGLERLRGRFDGRHGGDRAAWMASLAPIAGLKLLPGTAAAAVVTTATAATAALETGIALGGILMAKKVVVIAGVAAALAAVVSVAVVISKRSNETVEPGGSRPTIELADTSPVPRRPAESDVKPGSLAPKPYVPGDEDRAPSEGPLVAKGAPHASVSGRVVDQQGAPQAGVPVSLTIWQTALDGADVVVETQATNERRLQTRTEADGRFFFDDLPAQAETRVRARPDLLCDAVRSVTITKPGPVDAGDLVAVAGGSVAGAVLLPQGAPAKGVRVYAWKSSDESGFQFVRIARVAGDEARSAVTAANGQYRIDGLSEGEHQVGIAPEEHPDDARSGIKVKKGEVTWDVDFKLAAGVSLAGIVRGPGGEPVAGAIVSASQAEMKLDDPSRPAMRTRTANTGPDGRFAIQGLRQEPFNVRARKPGFVSATHESAVPGTEIALQLKTSGVAFGRVRNAMTGAGVKDFSVKVANEPLFQGPARGRVVRGAEAAKAAGVEESPELFAVVDLPAVPVRLSVRAEDFADFEVEGVRAAPGDKTEIAVSLTPQATVRGVVRDPAGNPVLGARVVATNAKAPKSDVAEPGMRVRRRVISRRTAPAAGATAPAAGDAPEIARAAVSGEDGSFVIKSLPGGEYRLTATHAGFAESPAAVVAVKPGDAADGINLTLEAGGTFAGRALDADGNPLPGAAVSLRKKGAGRFPGGIAGVGGREPGVASSTGDFEISGLKAGEYVATLSDGHGEGNFHMAVSFGDDEPSADDVPVTIEAGKTTRKDLQMRPRASLAGVVRDGGKPAAGVRVALVAKGMPPFLAPGGVKTDEQGAFVLDKVSPGDYVLHVTPPGAALPTKKPVSLAPRAEQRITVDLPSGAIEGRVLDRATNKPVAGVSVTAAAERAPGEESHEVRGLMVTATSDGEAGGIQTMSVGGPEPVKTDSEGRYRLRYLEPGKYRVSIRGQEIMPQSKTGIAVEERQTVKEQDFGVDRGATLLVTVDPAGHDVGSVLVFASLDGSDDRSEPQHGSAKAPIKLSGLKPGRYRVRVDAIMDDLEGKAEVDVVAGQETRVTVKLSQKPE